MTGTPPAAATSSASSIAANRLSNFRFVARSAGDAPDIDVACSNSFGFGGTNACVILRRAE